MEAPARHRLQTLGWTLAVAATILNGLVVGYGSVWFQLFGESADADDYRVSAGGYGAAAVVLLLALPALLARRRTGWLPPVAALGALLLGALALSSWASVGQAEPGPGFDSWLDGVGGVVWAPWTWVMVLLGLISSVSLVRPTRPIRSSGSRRPSGPRQSP